MINDYFTIKYRPCAAAPFVECLFKYFFSPRPAPRRPWLNNRPKVLMPAIFSKLESIPSGHVRGPSGQMSFYKFVTYCLYMIIFLRQGRQGILPQHIHVRVRACARGNFVYRFLTLYFEFVRKYPDVPDALNASADLRPDGTPDGPLTCPDGINERVLSRGQRHTGCKTAVIL
jgi:hypothetical protein